jgi:predicted SnoaL-like aldol condensation-catalyzing enzyme
VIGEVVFLEYYFRMRSIRKQKIFDLLKGIETGDPESVKVVNEQKYIQHNPQTKESGVGLAELFAKLAKTNPKVEIVRLFEDGDFVFGHTIYNFSTERIGFEVFRYEGDQVVEHWDNIQPRVGDMVGGTTEVNHTESTEKNRDIVKQFIHQVFINNELNEFDYYVNIEAFVEHSTFLNLPQKCRLMSYQKNHRLLADGNFVLSVSEGENESAHSSFYDLFRLDKGLIVEHWDTLEKVPPSETWQNDNGKF